MQLEWSAAWAYGRPMVRQVLACILLCASSCVAPAMVLLRGPDGDLVRCEPSAAAPGYYGQEVSVRRCVEAYQQEGYVVVKRRR